MRLRGGLSPSSSRNLKLYINLVLEIRDNTTNQPEVGKYEKIPPTSQRSGPIRLSDFQMSVKHGKIAASIARSVNEARNVENRDKNNPGTAS